jgi:hypothetical protein
MKLSTRLVFVLLIALAIEASFLVLVAGGAIPDKLVTPLVALFAVNVTLIGLLVSAVQWEKARLGNEVLKEQFKLVSTFLDHLRTHPNSGFRVTSRDGKVLMGGLVRFSALNYDALEAAGLSERFVVIHFLPEEFPQQLFAELDNPIIHSPFFPTEVSRTLAALETAKYFRECDYAKNWFSDSSVGADLQFVLLRGARKEDLEKKPLRIPGGSGHLRISDVLAAYSEFTRALDHWLSANGLDVRMQGR